MITEEKKSQFLRILTSMSNVELNEFIKSKGKKPKLIPMCILVKHEQEDDD